MLRATTKFLGAAFIGACLIWSAGSAATDAKARGLPVSPGSSPASQLLIFGGNAQASDHRVQAVSRRGNVCHEPQNDFIRNVP
jgi:hypothetical protein